MSSFLYNGNKVRVICSLDALTFGKQKEPVTPPVWSEGTCDICRYQQSIAPIEHWDGLDLDRQEITLELPPAPNP